jgi:hypothetical protein
VSVSALLGGHRKTRGVRGGPSFSGGVSAPLPARQDSALHALRAGPKLQDLVRLRDLAVVPAGLHDPQLPVLFARNGERNRVRDENRGDRELLR